tara:strand:- start:739 stop:1389 length:651 start_codon:yes stop_codon:yes gene_type:complete
MSDMLDSVFSDLAMSPRDMNLDDTLLVKFYMNLVPNDEKSLQEGRPIMESQEWIEITQPGNKLSVVQEPVNNGHKQRFPRHYNQWKDRTSEDQEILSGTPLAEWTPVSRTDVEELKYLNIRTVEQLANVADVNAGNMTGLMGLKQKAQKYLEAAKENVSSSAIFEMKAENAEMKAENAEMKRKIDQLVKSNQFENVSEEKSENVSAKKRGRPSKAA